MKKIAAIAVMLLLPALPAAAGAEGWTSYRIPESGTSVDIPSSIFTEEAARPDGYGMRYRTGDGRADITVQAVPNDGSSPAVFLARKNPPSGIIYKRITPRFFVVSSIRRGKIWYNRCNFAPRYVHCVLINYPAAEKRQWDAIVTRVSRTLSGG
ncbi:hypothetical protein [Bradyrhizobium sp. Bra78]|uniref:hypothetical protein n=1 Tax=Bradyrhizobium sp. Bra78 TaxID=2926010 RepID=UPI0021C5E9BE|nr:hypothetical protein [Bradyrhizobium sp. Bra78]